MGFMKDFLEDLKYDFVSFLMEFHENIQLLNQFNTSFIILIPKWESPVILSEYKHISLIGYMYKVLAEVLVNRLKKVICSVIFGT